MADGPVRRDGNRAIVTAYWEHYRLTTSEQRTDRLQADDFDWAWAEVEERSHDVSGLPLILALAKAAPTDVALMYLGAGPLENLLCEHGAEVAQEVEQVAR